MSRVEAEQLNIFDVLEHAALGATDAMRQTHIHTPLALCFLCLALPAQAEIHLPRLISDGMVLQQQSGAPIWGNAEPNREVTVSFQGQALSTSADDQGAWKVEFKNLNASKEPATLTIQAAGESKDFHNVLVGEVWLASGQSNMKWLMKQSTTAEYAKTVNNPLIKEFNVFSKENGWKSAEHGVSEFSGVAYHFAERLQKELNIPVGIIAFSSGGTPIEAFISEEAIQNFAHKHFFVEKKQRALEEWEAGIPQKQYEEAYAKYKPRLDEWESNGSKGRKPRGPRKPASPEQSKGYHSTVYRGIARSECLHYGAKGIIWYQGESNASPVNSAPHLYEESLGCLVKDWRSAAGKELPFYYVQLANFKEQPQPERNEGWMTVIDEMRRALDTIPNSGMAVTNETDPNGSLHPANKKDAGERLALWALAKDYGKDLIYSGPLYKSAEFQGNRVVVSFDHAKGLRSKDGKPLQWFEVAGEDGKWTKAEAVIQGEQVIVSAVSVKKPTQVRYAWSPNPLGVNFVNEAGLPASCFSSSNK